MGRYYNGDIDGKFWFALQPSDCADRFGVEGVPPSELNYGFYEDDLPNIESEILRIETAIGEKKAKIDALLKTNNGGYNSQLLIDNNITKEELRDYADLLLGYEIRDCVKENGACCFTAEL